jgi:hypothetical protein
MSVCLSDLREIYVPFVHTVPALQAVKERLIQLDEALYHTQTASTPVYLLELSPAANDLAWESMEMQGETDVDTRNTDPQRGI